MRNPFLAVWILLSGFALASTGWAQTTDEIRNFDGAMPALVTGGSSASPGTPAYTTHFNNEVVLAIFNLSTVNFSTVPSTGTNILNLREQSSPYELGAYVNYQTKATAGSVASVTGSFSSANNYAAGTLALIPTSGNSVNVRTPQSVQQSTGATATVNKPTGTTTGDFLLGCDFTDGIKNSITPPASFTPILVENDGQNDYLRCYAKVAGSSEPSTYVFTEAVTTNPQTAFVAAFGNVLYPDEILTSASASFNSAGDLGKDICVSAGTNGAYRATNPTPQSCGVIGQVLSSTTLIGYGVWNTATNTSGLEYRYGTDNTTWLQNSINNLTKRGHGLASSRRHDDFELWAIDTADHFLHGAPNQHHRPRFWGGELGFWSVSRNARTVSQ